MQRKGTVKSSRTRGSEWRGPSWWLESLGGAGAVAEVRVWVISILGGEGVLCDVTGTEQKGSQRDLSRQLPVP